MPSIGSLTTSVSGLNAQRRVLDVTAHNIANANTEGYHRQRVELRSLSITGVSGIFSGPSRQMGVDATKVTRAYDELLATRFQREDAARSNANALRTTMDTIEKLFPEPGDLGIAHQLDQFWASWSSVATNPGSAAARQELLARADQLVSSLNRAAADLQGVAETAMARVGLMAEDVNSLADQLATTNRAIGSSANPSPDLFDYRDQLIGQLARLTGATARITDNGMADVYIGNRALVVGADLVEPVDGTTGALRWVNGNQPVVITSGEAAGLAATINDIVPRYQAMIDGIASNLVTGVNALHVAGYDQAGATGWNFFDPTALTAGTIALSADVAGQPGRIAAGAPVLPGPTAPGPLDGGQAREIARLADAAGGVNAQYRQMITALAAETRGATTRAAVQDQVAETAAMDLKSIGSVDLDEEMATLVSAQRAYEANARVITAIDEMLGFLIERTGVVGR